jgi:hypothetical protein
VTIDFNFYAEQHLDQLEGMTDLELPQGWTLGQLISALYDAKLMLWAEILHIDRDGNVEFR